MMDDQESGADANRLGFRPDLTKLNPANVPVPISR